ncbi:Uma2 family endonuclease [Kineococcus auxinigenes]|uniref:Uma2 family endonuclease n=1 Tax=unclassified Kineococcus TaxID=2621656 RepID=UPI003D7E763E
MSVSIQMTWPLRVEDLPEDENGPRMEIVDGSLHVTPLADLRHQRLVGRLAHDLVDLAPAGWVVLPGANVLRRAATDRLLIPDVVVPAEEALAAGGAHADPSDVLLAVEVESPSTRTADRLLKRDLYAQWKLPNYWIVDPEGRTLTRLALGPGRRYDEGPGGTEWLTSFDDSALWGA